MSTWYDSDALADGAPFESWEKPARFGKTYHVAALDPAATDAGPGSAEIPFKTISAAAAAMMPGERAVIHGGVYREAVRPARGGDSPERMIGYEAAPGENVAISGAVVYEGPYKICEDWRFTARGETDAPVVYELDISGLDFRGYNPFGMVNVLQDRHWLWHKRIPMDPFFLRRGRVLVDGVPMKQTEHPSRVGSEDNIFFIHHNGTKLYLRLAGGRHPGECKIELVIREQVFAPEVYGLGYIRLKGLRLQNAANGFPVPQRGLLSASRGHHFIVEDCVIEGANSVGIDMGNECWNAAPPAGETGRHIVRRSVVRDCGVCGLAAIGAQGLLIEDCLFEDIGYHNMEHMYESAGIKFHHSVNSLYRRNVMRRICHASGFWLDCGNVNNRICGNLFYDIHSRAAAVHYEGTHYPNRVDHNVIGACRTQDDPDGNPGWGGTAIQAEGTDFMTVDHNLIFDCENDGFYSNPVSMRIIGDRGGVARKHVVEKNIFCDCRRTAVTFNSEHNRLNDNLYVNEPRGFIHIGTAPGGATAPDSIPQMRLGLQGARDFIGWEADGDESRAAVDFDHDSMILRISGLENIKGRGPFENVPMPFEMPLDPRAL